MTSPLNVFIRQPFTESGEKQRVLIQGAMNVISEFETPLGLSFLTPLIAQHADSFKKNFEISQGKTFTPKHFRDYRLSLLDQADVFINIRAGLSESSAVEIAYNIFKGNKAPIFFAIWEKAPIKTTLLRELDDHCDVTYTTFTKPEELRTPLQTFLEKAVRTKQ